VTLYQALADHLKESCVQSVVTSYIDSLLSVSPAQVVTVNIAFCLFTDNFVVLV